MKNIFILIMAFILLSCEKDTDKPDFQLEIPSQLSELDYEIYSLILNKYSKTDLIINQKTSTIRRDNSYELFRSDELFDFEDTMIDNYYDLNSNHSYLDQRINYANGNLILISSNEVDYFFKSENDSQNWDRFYKYYPNASGLIEFSRIGYNNNFSKAIVEYQKIDKNGSGISFTYYVYKIDGKWNLQEYSIVISN